MFTIDLKTYIKEEIEIDGPLMRKNHSCIFIKNEFLLIFGG